MEQRSFTVHFFYDYTFQSKNFGTQILKDLYQTGGDVNGLTFRLQSALLNDANFYILKTEEGLIMFNCGCATRWSRFFEILDLKPNDIRYCLLTHPHLDHAKGVHRLKQRGVKIIAIKETAESVVARDKHCAKYLHHKKFHTFEVDVFLTDCKTH